MCVFVCEREEEGEYSSGCVKIQSGDDDDDDDDDANDDDNKKRNTYLLESFCPGNSGYSLSSGAGAAASASITN